MSTATAAAGTDVLPTVPEAERALTGAGDGPDGRFSGREGVNGVHGERATFDREDEHQNGTAPANAVANTLEDRFAVRH